MVYAANIVSGAYQTLPYINFYLFDLESGRNSYSRRTMEASSTVTGWLSTSPQFSFSTFEFDTSFQILPSRIEASYFFYLTESFAHWSSTATRIEEAKAARHSIQEFANLKQNWDGYGATPISDQARRHALRFIDMLEAAPGGGLPMPEISPMPSGTISFEWETPSARAYLEIGNTLYSGFIKTEQGPFLLQGGADYLDQSVVSLIQSAVYAANLPSAPITEIHAQTPHYDLLAA